MKGASNVKRLQKLTRQFPRSSYRPEPAKQLIVRTGSHQDRQQRSSRLNLVTPRRRIRLELRGGRPLASAICVARPAPAPPTPVQGSRKAKEKQRREKESRSGAIKSPGRRSSPGCAGPPSAASPWASRRPAGCRGRGRGRRRSTASSCPCRAWRTCRCQAALRPRRAWCRQSIRWRIQRRLSIRVNPGPHSKKRTHSKETSWPRTRPDTC
jgi:hypothetical protein